MTLTHRPAVREHPFADPHAAATEARAFASRDDDLTNPRTQIVGDREDYLGQGRNDVGRRIADDQVELFITADVPGSLQKEFMLHAPEFVAVHDIGTSASLHLLSSLAAAAGGRVQRLSVRRQGQGVALAALQFVQIPLPDGTPVRIYSTDLNADTATRDQVARVLLAFSRLGVMLVGELPPHVLQAQLAPVQDAMARNAWPNRDLLMVPLGSATAMAAQAARLGRGGPVAVHVAPHAERPRQVWNFISGAWNRLHGRPGGEHALETDLALALPRMAVPDSEACTEPMPLQLPAAADSPARAFGPGSPSPSARPVSMSEPLPRPGSYPLPIPLPLPIPGSTNWRAYVGRCMAIKGSTACCVFDLHSVQVLAQEGHGPAPGRLAQQGATLLKAAADAARALGLGAARPDADVGLGAHHLLLLPVTGHPGVAVALLIQAATGNPALARMQLQRVDPPQ